MSLGSRLTDVRRAALQEAFTIMDRDGSSKFSLDDLATVLRATGHGDSDIKLKLSACRKKCGSLLSSAEFWAIVQGYVTQGAVDSFVTDTQRLMLSNAGRRLIRAAQLLATVDNLSEGPEKAMDNPAAQEVVLAAKVEPLHHVEFVKVEPPHHVEFLRCCEELREKPRAKHLPDMAFTLAKSLAKGKRVPPTVIEAAVQRELGIDVRGKLAGLIGPITESCEVYEKARQRMRQDPGYEMVLGLEPIREKNLRQESQDFETVNTQAWAAQDLLKSIVASDWQLHPQNSSCQVPVQNCAAAWVDQCLSPGVKSRQRSLEKVQADYGGDASRLKDCARMTLEYTDCARMAFAAGSEMDANGMTVVSLKNRYLYPTPLGYGTRDVSTSLSSHPVPSRVTPLVVLL